LNKTKHFTLGRLPIVICRLAGAAILSCAAGAAHANEAASAPPIDAPSPSAHLRQFATRASELAMQAVSLIGIRYGFGGHAPEQGLDCSGLVRHVFKQAWGVVLPRTSEEISRVGAQVEQRDLEPGDLVFYNTLKRAFSHVGIYLGDNRFIHSPSSGGYVRIDQMDSRYWKNRFDGARRITAPDD
jgi:cell wall-associated NlpC family hydrolase